MTGEELLDSMEYIDAVWVEKAENPAPKQRMRKGWIGAIAACLAVVIGVYLFLPNRVLVFTPWQIADLMLGEGEIAGDTQHYMPSSYFHLQEASFCFCKKPEHIHYQVAEQARVLDPFPNQ